MPVIRITSIKDETRQAQKSGAEYTVRVAKGTKYDSGDEWETPIFLNDKKLLRQLEEFGKGDVANFKFEKNGRFWDLRSIEEPDAELIDKLDAGDYKQTKQPSGQSKSSANFKGGSSDKMSKEEWAEKDRLTNIRIAKAVALKAAVENTKVGTPTDSLKAWADELLPWLLDTDISPFKEDTNIDDPLSPPVD